MDRNGAGRFVLDEMGSPDGPIRLLAFRKGAAVRIGVANGSGDLLADIGVHGGSIDYEPYAWRGRGRQVLPEPQRWETDGLVSSRAERGGRRYRCP